MFWSITLLTFYLFKGENVQKLEILLFFASYIASILKGLELHVTNLGNSVRHYLKLNDNVMRSYKVGTQYES